MKMSKGFKQRKFISIPEEKREVEEKGITVTEDRKRVHEKKDKKRDKKMYGDEEGSSL